MVTKSQDAKEHCTDECEHRRSEYKKYREVIAIYKTDYLHIEEEKENPNEIKRKKQSLCLSRN